MWGKCKPSLFRLPWKPHRDTSVLLFLARFATKDRLCGGGGRGIPWEGDLAAGTELMPGEELLWLAVGAVEHLMPA